MNMSKPWNVADTLFLNKFMWMPSIYQVMYIGPAAFAGGETVVGWAPQFHSVTRPFAI